MKSGITFKQLAELQREALKNQPPVTIEQAKSERLARKNRVLFDKKFGTIENCIAYLKSADRDEYLNLLHEFEMDKINKYL